MIAKHKIEKINQQINEIKAKIKDFQIKNGVSPKKKPPSPTHRIDQMDSIISRSRNKLGSNGSLYHPQLDLVIGECIYSPLNYSPAENYPKSSEKILEKVRSLKGRPHDESELPYDIEKTRQEFLTDVLKRKTKNALPHETSYADASITKSSSVATLPAIRQVKKALPPRNSKAKKPSPPKSRAMSKQTTKQGTSAAPAPATATGAAKKFEASSSSSFDDNYDFLFEPGEKHMLLKTESKVTFKAPPPSLRKSFDSLDSLKRDGSIESQSSNQVEEPKASANPAVSVSGKTLAREENSASADYADDDYESDVPDAKLALASKLEDDSLLYDEEGFDDEHGAVAKAEPRREEVTVAAPVKPAAPDFEDDSLIYEDDDFDGDEDSSLKAASKAASRKSSMEPVMRTESDPALVPSRVQSKESTSSRLEEAPAQMSMEAAPVSKQPIALSRRNSAEPVVVTMKSEEAVEPEQEEAYEEVFEEVEIPKATSRVASRKDSMETVSVTMPPAASSRRNSAESVAGADKPKEEDTKLAFESVQDGDPDYEEAFEEVDATKLASKVASRKNSIEAASVPEQPVVSSRRNSTESIVAAEVPTKEGTHYVEPEQDEPVYEEEAFDAADDTNSANAASRVASRKSSLSSRRDSKEAIAATEEPKQEEAEYTEEVFDVEEEVAVANNSATRIPGVGDTAVIEAAQEGEQDYEEEVFDGAEAPQAVASRKNSMEAAPVSKQPIALSRRNSAEPVVVTMKSEEAVEPEQEEAYEEVFEEVEVPKATSRVASRKNSMETVLVTMPPAASSRRNSAESVAVVDKPKEEDTKLAFESVQDGDPDYEEAFEEVDNMKPASSRRNSTDPIAGTEDQIVDGELVVKTESVTAQDAPNAAPRVASRQSSMEAAPVIGQPIASSARNSDQAIAPTEPKFTDYADEAFDQDEGALAANKPASHVASRADSMESVSLAASSRRSSNDPAIAQESDKPRKHISFEYNEDSVARDSITLDPDFKDSVLEESTEPELPYRKPSLLVSIPARQESKVRSSDAIDSYLLTPMAKRGAESLETIMTADVHNHNLAEYLLTRPDMAKSPIDHDLSNEDNAEENHFSNTLERFIERQKSEITERRISITAGRRASKDPSDPTETVASFNASVEIPIALASAAVSENTESNSPTNPDSTTSRASESQVPSRKASVEPKVISKRNSANNIASTEPIASRRNSSDAAKVAPPALSRRNSADSATASSRRNSGEASASTVQAQSRRNSSDSAVESAVTVSKKNSIPVPSAENAAASRRNFSELSARNEEIPNRRRNSAEPTVEPIALSRRNSDEATVTNAGVAAVRKISMEGQAVAAESKRLSKAESPKHDASAVEPEMNRRNSSGAVVANRKNSTEPAMVASRRNSADQSSAKADEVVKTQINSVAKEGAAR